MPKPAAIAKPAIPANKVVRSESFVALEVPVAPKQLDDIFYECDEEMDDQMDITEPIIEDIDANDREDPQCCTEYVNEIFEYCHQREVCLLLCLFLYLLPISLLKASLLTAYNIHTF